MATRRAEIAAAHKAAANRIAAAAESAAVEAYARAWRTVADELERTALAAATATGPDYTLIARQARLRRSLDRLEDLADQAALAARRAAVDRAQTIVAMTPGATGESLAAARIALRQPRPDALAAIVARRTQAITADFAVLPSFVRQAIRDQLTIGVAAGLGPEVVARRIRDNARGILGRGLDRSRIIARTELLDASRAATHATYLANADEVVGWRWLATLSERTCPACMSLHGQIFDLDEILDGHPRCRCTQVPVLRDELRAASDVGDSLAWVRALDEEAQAQVLGRARQAWLNEAGWTEQAWRAMSVRRDNPGWRTSRVVRPVRDLPLPVRAAA